MNSNSDLATAFRFSHDQLTLNKMGKLSQSQADFIKQLMSRSIVLYGFGLVSVVVAISLFQRRAVDWLVVFLVVSVLIMFAVICVRYFRIRHQLQQMSLSAAAGNAILKSTQVTPWSKRYHYLTIGGKQFDISEVQSKAIIAGQQYRVYYILNLFGFQILSIELV
jgi:hypothetical protein